MFRQQRSATFGVLDRLANTPIPHTDQVQVVAADGVIDRPWLADQAEELAVEQEHLFDAEGLTESRTHEIEAARWQLPAAVCTHATESLVAASDAAGRYAVAIREALAPFSSRASDAKRWYWVRMAALYLGDVGSCTGAMILLGEVPALAFVLALSVAGAAVVAGLVGADIKRVRLAAERQMDPEAVPAHLQPWAHLFWGVEAGQVQVQIMAKVAAAAILCILTGVLALRWSLDGPLAGLAFGCFATAIALASVWNSYSYTDTCAEMIDAAEKDHQTLMRKASKAAHGDAICSRARALAEAQSIEAEFASRGQAARAAIMAAKFEGFVHHPHIVGHGPASPAAPTPPDPRPRPVWRQRTESSATTTGTIGGVS